MGSKTRALASGELHTRESLFLAGNLGSVNSELVIPSDGCSTVSLDLRGTFSGTFEVAGTVDGTNWIPIPVRPVNIAAIAYLAAIAGTTSGTWVGKCGQYLRVRVRCTAYTSGTASAVIAAENGVLDDSLNGAVTTTLVTATAAAAAALTLTLPSPGAGLRQYITYLSIVRFAAAVLTPAAVPVIVTTTNLPGALAFSFPADAAAQGTVDRWREDFTYPLAASAQGAATTVVMPATPGVLWRATAGYYVAP